MKKVIAFIVLSVAVVSIFGQTQATKKVLLTLQPGETLQTSESCIELSYAANQLYVVTRKGDKLFVYEGGQRKGPFNANAVKIKDCSGVSDYLCAIYNHKQADALSEMVTYSETGKMALKFKGKTYGPYKMVTDVKVAEDKSWFYALVVNDGKFLVVGSDVQTQPIDGNASKIMVSSNGKRYLVVCKEGEGLDAAMMSMDMSKMSQEKLLELMKKQAEKNEKAGPPQTYVYTNGGKKFGPYPTAELSENNPAFNITGGENWYMIMDNVLYLNGVKIKQFSTDNVSLNTCNIWISPDGKRYAYTSYKNLVFSDGATFASPLKLDSEKKDGKTYLKWISLENGKDIVSYTKEF
jgi:hypothetical protein